MSQKEIIAGLDVGTTKTCCVISEVDLDDGNIDIIGCGMVPSDGMRRGVVVNLDTTTEAIKGAVEKAQRMAGNVTIRSVVVGVTGEHVSSLNSRGVIAITSSDKEITHSDVDRVVESSKVIVLPPEREIVHAIPRGFIVDGQDGIKDPVGLAGSRLEVETHIVTAASSFLDNTIKCIHKAGLAIESTILEPIATSEAALIPAERELGVALVDIGGGTTDLAVFTNGEICYTAVLPIGGEYVTKDIGVGLRASYEEAERIKVGFGSASKEFISDDDVVEYTKIGADESTEIPRELLFRIIEPRMTEILTMIRTELIKSEQLDLLAAGIVITGGVSQMPGILDLANEVLNMPVRLASPRDIGGLHDTVDSPIYTTAVGLIINAAKRHTLLHEQEKSDTLKQGLRDFAKKIFGKWIN